MKILTINQRFGMGDMVILLPYIHAISKKFNTPVSLLAKESSRASDLLSEDEHVNEIITLDKEKDGLGGFLKLSKELKKRNFDKAFIFNNSLRYNLVSRFSGIKSIYQYPFSLRKNNMVLAAKTFTEKVVGQKVSTEPTLIIKKSSNNFDKKYKHILFAVSASGPTKIWDIENYIKLAIEISKKVECKFYIAAGPNDINLVKKFKESDVGKDCVSFEKLSIKETLPIIKNCDCYIGNDTGFGHISVALKIKSLFIFMDTPIRVYGSYAPSLISTVEPEGENQSTVHNTLGKKSISFKEVLEKTLNLII